MPPVAGPSGDLLTRQLLGLAQNQQVDMAMKLVRTGAVQAVQGAAQEHLGRMLDAMA